MKNIKNKIVFLFVLAFLFSCSPMKRLERFEKRHPYLFESIKVVDTFTYFDTVYVPTIKHDTIFRITKDTMYLTKDRLKVKLLYKDSIIYLDGECVGDTVYIENDIIREVPKFQTKEPPKFQGLKKLFNVYFIAFFLLALIVFLLNRIYKPP
ncbi:hypothetical protein [Brumimicrobium aurantiacum]|uniref:Lipoprotein n=1 Tax=Brumimicrobium aurantiacum TaxID=1737063 RepID=A0A3E1EZ64_9FLAO|nr:hypothetical protein [Brumimicrobium aurantiacum]RFC54859.1 hypothetical protein DXU93_03295 [Brumimicrobium aurantiacum]